MRTVSRFESNLLQILRCLLRRAPLSQALPAVVRDAERPSCLSRDCVHLMRQMLSNGIVTMLSREDGWRRERYLRGDLIAAGRLWERSKPSDLGLEFSANSADFLIWITANSPITSTWKPQNKPPFSLGDRFLFFLAFQALRGTEVGNVWCRQPLFQSNGLCALMFPNDFAQRQITLRPDFAPWLIDSGAAVLEALQGRLADRWAEIERSKGRIVSAERMRWLGGVQNNVLSSWLSAADASGRRDLARFVLVAARNLLRASPAAANWTASLNVDGLRMADRMQTYRAAFAFLRQVQQLRGWQQQSQQVGYFDEGYAASQLWKADWEQLEGETHSQSAGTIVRQLEPLESAAPTPQSTAKKIEF